MEFSRSNNIDDNVGIPEDLRCKRSDGKQWRCSALSMPDKTVCEKHYIQAKKRAANSAMRASLKKTKRKSIDEGDMYLESKTDEGDVSLGNSDDGEYQTSVSIKKHKEKSSTRQPLYSPGRVAMKSLSNQNFQKVTDDSSRDIHGENHPNFAYREPTSATGSLRGKSQKKSCGSNLGDQSSKSSGSSAETGTQTCHQCRRTDRATVIWCLECDKRGYCDGCISKRYPDISMEEIQRACPACRGACTCKACFHPDSLIKLRIREIAPRDKLQYLHRLLSLVLPVIKQIHLEQSFELELETRARGVKTDIPRAKIHPDEQMCCDCCKVPIIDYHRHCPSCVYDLCLTCCHDLRQASLASEMAELSESQKIVKDEVEPAAATLPQLPETVRSADAIELSHAFPDWKPDSDGSIPCPPKESGGCGCQSLLLRRIFKMNWVAKLVKNAEEMVNGCSICSMTGPQSCFACSGAMASGLSEISDTKFLKAALRKDSNDNYVYCPAPQDIKLDGISHFQTHWHRGEPILVKHMADFLLTSSWEPTVLWRGIQETVQDYIKEGNGIPKVVDCLDRSEVDIEVDQFIEGYSEGCLGRDGERHMLKLKDWPHPRALEEFLYYQRPEFLSKLPLLEYIHSKWGLLNLAAKLPHDSLQADVGPKLFIAYGASEELGRGDSVINLHVNMGDVVCLLMHTSGIKSQGWSQARFKSQETLRETNEPESINEQELLEGGHTGDSGQTVEEKGKSLDVASNEYYKEVECGLELNAKKDDIMEGEMCNITAITSDEMQEIDISHKENDNDAIDSKKNHAGALWDIFRRQDIPKLNEYLRIHWGDFEVAGLSVDASGVHPVHDQAVFLNRDHIQRLKVEYEIEPWTFHQDICDAVFIPAGCAFQMRNLRSNVQLGLDFLSPESLGESVRLAQDIRRLPNDHEAKLQMLEVGKMSLYAASSAIREIQKLALDSRIGPDLGCEDRNLTVLVSENIEKIIKWRRTI
ncbi:E3 ubiquitin-protein ligase JMJ24-like [Aristolochia californica]|uniref:E3 ubiquitin-protein ligase JMJ24-like n=1 Tax=Aristolochia californica TaxID=171875 RepID=UPI0035D851C9